MSFDVVSIVNQRYPTMESLQSLPKDLDSLRVAIRQNNARTLQRICLHDREREVATAQLQEARILIARLSKEIRGLILEVEDAKSAVDAVVRPMLPVYEASVKLQTAVQLTQTLHQMLRAYEALEKTPLMASKLGAVEAQCVVLNELARKYSHVNTEGEEYVAWGRFEAKVQVALDVWSRVARRFIAAMRSEIATSFRRLVDAEGAWADRYHIQVPREADVLAIVTDATVFLRTVSVRCARTGSSAISEVIRVASLIEWNYLGALISENVPENALQQDTIQYHERQKTRLLLQGPIFI